MTIKDFLDDISSDAQYVLDILDEKETEQIDVIAGIVDKIETYIDNMEDLK